jgi:hypothetical protein
MYTSQLVKTALFEVSRFCFENLRVATKSNDSVFSSHWSMSDIKTVTDPQTGAIKGMAVKADLGQITDNGLPSFFKTVTDVNDKKQVYKDILGGLTQGAKLDPKQYEYYFGFCQTALPLLCQQFKDDVAANTTNTTTEVSIGGKIAAAKGAAATSNLKAGGNACLTLERLKSIRTAMKKTEDVAKQFEEMGEKKGDFALQMIKNPKFYQRGKGGAGEDSLDEISSASSSDMLQDDKGNNLDQLETDCKNGGSGKKECDEFLVIGDSLDSAIQNVETEMNLKRELEVAQIAELKNKPADLEKYLEENGHYDLLAKIKTPPVGFDIEKEIAAIYNARKIAEIENLKSKLGKRQISEDDVRNTTAGKNLLIDGNIKDAKEERARLAQVVMFNNIITSQLQLYDQSGAKVGRNVNGWNKEMEGMKSSNTYDDTLFTGVQQIANDEGNKGDDTTISGGDIIDSILGKETKSP